MFLTVNGVFKRFINNTNNKQKTTLQDFFLLFFFFYRFMTYVRKIYSRWR